MTSQPVIRSITIVGSPSTLTIGASAQLRAAAGADDGSFQDVTQQATWRSSDPAVCEVSSAGVATGRGAGTTTITASYTGTDGTVTIACGFAITATVRDTTATGAPLAAVRVEVAGGPLSGRAFETDAAGRVTLPVVGAAGFALYFKKPGFDDTRVEVFELPRQTQLDVVLQAGSSRTRLVIEGVCTGNNFSTSWTLAIPNPGAATLTKSNTGASQLCVRLSTVGTEQRVGSTVLGACPEISSSKVIDAGMYELFYSLPSACPAGRPWSFVLEYPR